MLSYIKNLIPFFKLFNLKKISDQLWCSYVWNLFYYIIKLIDGLCRDIVENKGGTGTEVTQTDVESSCYKLLYKQIYIFFSDK